MPQIDTIRDTVKVVEIDGLKVILQRTLGKAVENVDVIFIHKRNC